MILWTLCLRNVVARLSGLLVKYILNSLSFSNIDISFWSNIDNLRANIARLAELKFWWTKDWVDIEVDKAPVFKHAMKPDNAAYITW